MNIFQVVYGRRWVAGDAVLFVGPLAEIYQLASLGAEGTEWIVLPLGGLTTGRTLHKEKIKG